ncbi:MAG: aldo/keto reductase, partial [Thermodesulfobacteriota bacterium]
VGISNFSANKMRQFHNALSQYDLNLVSNQVNYSLLNRKIETNGILDAAKELGICIIAYSPLASGLLTGKFHDDPDLIKNRQGFRKYFSGFKREGLKKSRPVVDALKELAEKYQVTPSQIALNWIINFHGNGVVAIPGATAVGQARDNANSMMFDLSKDELDYLDRLSSQF